MAKVYCEGNEETINKVVELIKENLGKGINVVNCFPKMIVLDGSERCDCGGDILPTCQDCGEHEIAE